MGTCTLANIIKDLCCPQIPAALPVGPFSVDTPVGVYWFTIWTPAGIIYFSSQ